MLITGFIYILWSCVEVSHCPLNMCNYCVIAIIKITWFRIWVEPRARTCQASSSTKLKSQSLQKKFEYENHRISHFLYMCHPLYLILRESLSLGTVLFSSVDNTRLPGSVCISNTSMCIFGEFGFPSLSPWQEEPPRQLRKADSGDVANTGFLHSSIFFVLLSICWEEVHLYSKQML